MFSPLLSPKFVRSLRAKVTKYHEWLQAKNYWLVPVVADTSGALDPEAVCLLDDFALLKTVAADQHGVANYASSLLPRSRARARVLAPTCPRPRARAHVLASR